MAIEHISDTARWVAVYRAMESERPDALFRDPYARRLAGAKGQEIVDTMRRGRGMAWALIVRTAVFDELIMAQTRDARVDTVLNLAAGLDTRPWRLALPSTLSWVDVDLPAILRHKQEHIGDDPPHCNYEAIGTDLTDDTARREVLARVAARGKRVLAITEGLLVYLTPEQVAALATDLGKQTSIGSWIIDLASPRLLRIMKRHWGRAVTQGNAPFRFAPAESSDFFRPLGWREVEFRSALEEARRLKREMRAMWLWRLLGRLSSARKREEVRRMSGIVLLARDREGV